MRERRLAERDLLARLLELLGGSPWSQLVQCAARLQPLDAAAPAPAHPPPELPAARVAPWLKNFGRGR